MARTVLVGKRWWRVLKRWNHSFTLQPLDSEYPHVTILRDPSRPAGSSGERWGVSDGGRGVTWYRKVAADVFEAIP